MKNYENRLKLITPLSITLCSVAAVHASPDYPPAAWNPPSGCTKWYTSGYGHHFCVIHDMEGYYASSISYLNTCSVSASVYYAVNGKQDASSDSGAGDVTQMVRESNYAWHVGCWNQWMFGTEHEGFASNPAWYTASLYRASSRLQRHLALVGGAPIDRNHIIGHNEWQNGNWKSWMAANYSGINTGCNSHTDPGQYWDWGHFMWELNFSPNVAVQTNPDGRLEVFAVQSDNTVGHIYQQTGGSWAAWSALGTWTHQDVWAARNANGKLQVITIGMGNDCNTVNQNSWTSWTHLNGWHNQLAVATNLDGRIEIFAIGGNQGVFHAYQTTANGSFSGWSQIGTWTANDLTVGMNADGRLQIFAVGTDDQCNIIAQTAANGGWGSWSHLGGTLSKIAVAQNTDGRLELFGFGVSDHYLYHSWQASANGTFGGWSTIGNWTGENLCVGRNQNGTLQVFTIGTDNQCNTVQQTTAGGAWGSWSHLGGWHRSLAVAANSDGHLELFGIGTNRQMYHAYQNAPNGTWGGWTSLGGSLR